jgi:adenosylcobyric acid synthase
MVPCLVAMAARPIFVGGTGSHVGKSWVTTALCRYLSRIGHRVAPFKAQNMSNNSAVCADGGEIGRAQAAQAAACGILPHTDMNPILLKPTGRFGSQVVLNGRPWQTLSARDYYTHFEFLLGNVLDAYERLSANYDFVIIEGAGSITELNLKSHDLVNLGLAVRLQAPCILVADIDRGGVFASVTGTCQLLDEAEAPLVRSFLVNRFRGDSSLFSDGVPILEGKSGRPCLGVFPFISDAHLDPEDSVGLEDHASPQCAVPHELHGQSSVAIVRLPHISNFTDFRLLPEAVFVTSPVDTKFDTVILPGTKSTIEDLLWLRDNGMEQWLKDQFDAGSRLIGICGGYQMLGTRIYDPHNVESPVREAPGLGFLPAETHLTREKLTRNVSARTPSGLRFEAYEIHMGSTTNSGKAKPFAVLEDGTEDGIRSGRVTGTYLHGALENRPVLEELVGHSLQARSILAKDAAYDRLAGWFAEHVNHRVLKSAYGI